VNFHTNRGDFLLKIRGGLWGGPWTGPMGWSMDQVHRVVHGPESMFCIHPRQSSKRNRKNWKRSDSSNTKLRGAYSSTYMYNEVSVMTTTLTPLIVKTSINQHNSGLYFEWKKDNLMMT